MGRLVPPTPLPLVGVLSVLFLRTAMAYTQNCEQRKYWDETRAMCVQCQPCTWSSKFGRDGAEIMPDCQQKNPDAFRTANQTGFFYWCDHVSNDYTDLLKRETPSTSTSTAKVRTTTIPTSQQALRGFSEATGNNTKITLGLGLTTGLVLILLVVLAIWYFYKRRMRSPSSSLSGSSRGTESSSDGSPDETRKVLIDNAPIPVPEEHPFPPRVPVHHEIPVGASGFHPIAISSSPSPVLEGGPMVLTVDRPCPQCIAFWRHERTRTPYVDRVNVTNAQIELHEGRYSVILLCDGETRWSDKVDITITRVPEHRVLVDVGTGNHEPVQSSDDSNKLELVETDDLPIVQWMDIQQPSAEEPSQLVPSAQSLFPSLMGNMFNVLTGIDTSAVSNINFTYLTSGTKDHTHLSITRNRPTCSLLLKDLLNNEPAMLSLAIAVDPTNMLRLFAAVRGDMTPKQIDYVEYCTKGSGNTVRGLFEYIIRKNQHHDLTAYDFLNFMVQRNWQCGRVIKLLHFEHPDCSSCADLYRRRGDDSALICGKPPGFSYHQMNEHIHCTQSLKALALDHPYSEEFQQDSGIYFERDVWRAIGSHLGGMTEDFLQYIEIHNRGQINKSSYRTMLDRLVTMYSSLKVGTFVQWLYDHGHADGAKLVLDHHIRTIGDCDFCRSEYRSHSQMESQPYSPATHDPAMLV